VSVYQLIVLTNPVEGRDEEFNRWYSDVHIGDVKKVPGVTGARRFRTVGPGEYKYAAIYDFDCEDPNAVVAEIMARWKTDQMPGTDAFDESRFLMLPVQPIGR
jgi:hypothetical protein